MIIETLVLDPMYSGETISALTSFGAPLKHYRYCGKWRRWHAADHREIEEGIGPCRNWDCADFCAADKERNWMEKGMSEGSTVLAAGEELFRHFVSEEEWEGWRRGATAEGHYFNQVPVHGGRRVITTLPLPAASPPDETPIEHLRAILAWAFAGFVHRDGRRMRSNFGTWTKGRAGFREVDEDEERKMEPVAPTASAGSAGRMTIEPPSPRLNRERTVAALDKWRIPFEELSNGRIRYRLPCWPPPPELIDDLDLAHGGPPGWESFPMAWHV